MSMCMYIYNKTTEKQYNEVRTGYKVYYFYKGAYWSDGDNRYGRIGKLNETLIAEQSRNVPVQDFGFHIFPNLKDAKWLLKKYKKNYQGVDHRIVEVEYTDTTYIGQVRWWFSQKRKHLTDCEVAKTMRIVRDITPLNRRVAKRKESTSACSNT